MFKKDVNMLSGSIAKGLLTISMPIMIMNVLQALFNVIDMTVLKTFSGDGYAVGAVGTCSMLISLITGLLVGCSSGANVVIARLVGSGDRERAERAVGTAILFAFIGGIAVATIGIVFAETFLVWTNCPEILLSNAVLYFRLYFAGMPIQMVYSFSASALRSTGDTRRNMMFSLMGGCIKVISTVLFVALLKMSVEGVAIATILSWTVSCVMSVTALIRNDHPFVKLKLSRLRLYKREITDIVFIGVPAGLQQALYSIANTIISATVNTFGPAATTGISIANNFDNILYQIATAPSLAVMPYVSQNVGAGNIKRAKRTVFTGCLIAVGFAATLGALSAVFSGSLASIMSSDPEVIEYARQKMIIVSSTYFINGINQIFAASLRGYKRPIIPTVTTLIYMCALRFVWVYAIFPHFRNMTFLYLVWPIGWVLSISTMLFFYFPTVRRTEQAILKKKDINLA